jgi:hypothetical protein
MAYVLLRGAARPSFLEDIDAAFVVNDDAWPANANVL